MLRLYVDEKGQPLPIKNRSMERTCSYDELIFFFRNCFSPKERKFKMILLLQLGCECRIGEACAVSLDDFQPGSSFRHLKMLIQKKAKREYLPDRSFRIVGSNVIENKILPEAIAAHIRNWILDHYSEIMATEGRYIFPSSKMERMQPYTSPGAVQRFMVNKRNQLKKLYPDKGFGRTIGLRQYRKHHLGEYHDVVEPFYLWSTHMLKRFAGTAAWLATKDGKLVQDLLAHESFKVTSDHYIDAIKVASIQRKELVKNQIYDEKFFKSITGENDKVVAVWDFNS